MRVNALSRTHEPTECRDLLEPSLLSTGLEVSPACCGGICVLKYCGGCPIPYQCQFMMNCCDKCYTDCVSRWREAMPDV